MYESFNCINTGTPTGCMYDNGDTILWADRIRGDLAAWEKVADSLNLKHPAANPVYIIPVGQAYTNLKDSVDAGTVPGLTDIHPNDTEFYFVALVDYATIYGRSPIRLPTQTWGEWGGAFNPPSPALVLKLQEIVRETVCGYPGSGVNCLSTSTEKGKRRNRDIVIYPNHSPGIIHVESPPFR